ncbi:hypothetical protein D1872_336030 [compost metagenome]
MLQSEDLCFDRQLGSFVTVPGDTIWVAITTAGIDCLPGKFVRCSRSIVKSHNRLIRREVENLQVKVVAGTVAVKIKHK